MSNRYNLEIYQGSTFSTRLTITNYDGSSMDLTSYVPSGQIRYSFGSTGVMLSLKPVIYSTISGLVDLVISGSESSSLPCGQFPYDIELRTTGIADETILKPVLGYAFVQPEVTR